MVALLLLVLLVAPAGAEWTATPADEYDARFDRQRGWTGADGCYSVPCAPVPAESALREIVPELSLRRTLWLFSDTFWGDLDEKGQRLPGWTFLHNSVGLEEDVIEPRAREAAERVAFRGGVFTPPDGKGWFWVYDGVPHEGQVEVLLGQFAEPKTGKPGWNFEQVGNWIADLSLTDLKASNYRRLDWYRAPDSYGAGVMKDGDWLYVYGTRDVHTTRSLLLARCRTLDSPWEFYGTSGWGARAEPMAPEVSNELSVHKTRRGDYLLVSQSGPHVQVRRAPQPWGPWGTPQTVFTCSHEGGLFTYNAKAHPELSGEQGLLVSYNVNGPPAEVEKDGRIYRPRFLWLRGEEW